MTRKVIIAKKSQLDEIREKKESLLLQAEQLTIEIQNIEQAEKKQKQLKNLEKARKIKQQIKLQNKYKLEIDKEYKKKYIQIEKEYKEKQSLMEKEYKEKYRQEDKVYKEKSEQLKNEFQQIEKIKQENEALKTKYRTQYMKAQHLIVNNRDSENKYLNIINELKSVCLEFCPNDRLLNIAEEINLITQNTK